MPNVSNTADHEALSLARALFAIEDPVVIDNDPLIVVMERAESMLDWCGRPVQTDETSSHYPETEIHGFDEKLQLAHEQIVIRNRLRRLPYSVPELLETACLLRGFIDGALPTHVNDVLGKAAAALDRYGMKYASSRIVNSRDSGAALTDEEKKAVADLIALAARWPSSLWILPFGDHGPAAICKRGALRYGENRPSHVLAEIPHMMEVRGNLDYGWNLDPDFEY